MVLYDIFIFIFVVVLFFAIGWGAGALLCSMTAISYTGGAPRRKPTQDRVKDLGKHPRTRSEAAAIMHLEQLTNAKFPTVVPAWLGLELDGYNADLGIALEFSGPLHTKWTPTYEPYSRYYQRVMRDREKITKCAAHGVKLIIVDMSMPSRHYRNYIASRLVDFGVLMHVNGEYIAEQTAIPFRNPQIERELGLDTN